MAMPYDAGRISLVIPALNEEDCIGTVVRGVPADAVGEIIVVDNGSTDATAQVAEAEGARVVSEPHRGYGAACLAGALAATGDVLVFIDGDGSLDASQIPDVVRPLLDGRADFVQGSCVLGSAATGAVLPHQRFGNWLAIALLRLLCGVRVTDLGPFRAIRRELLLALDMRERTYGWPIEMVIRAQRAGARMMEVPIIFRNRIGGRSKVSGTVAGTLRSAYRIIGTIVRHAHRPRGAAHVAE
jgi:glycosyltransferase involved in cell wall biosynthesis